MNKRFYFLMVLLLVAPWVAWGQSVWNGNTDVSWYNENKTEFTITTAEQLAGLAELVNKNTNFDNKTIYLGANIVLNENSENYENWGTAEPVNEWTPIGNKDVFTGTFDGCGHTISGLYLNSSEDFYCGLFGYLTTGCITNINVTNSYIAAKNVGGICGNIKSEGKISKCSFNGIIVVNSSTNIYCGGICGSSTHGESTIESCYFEGELRVNMSNSSDFVAVYVGGITGVSGAAIESCYNKGNITVNGSNNSNATLFITYVGGIAGSVTSEVKYCYNTGKVLNTISEGTNSTGDIVGSIDDSIGNGTLLGNYNLSTEESKVEGVINANEEQFNSGYVAYELRKAGGNYGQALDEDGKYVNDENKTPVLLAFKENEGKEVYKLTLNLEGITEINGKPIYRNAEECNLLPTATYDKIMEDADPGQDLVWTNEKTGEVVAYGNTYTPTEDATLTATLETVYTITTKVEPVDAGTITVSKEKAQEGDEISVIVTANEGYKQATLTGATFTQKEDGSYTFTMPAENVTITATFKKIETGDSENEDYDGDLTKRYRLYLADQDFYQNDEYDEEGLVLYSRHDKKYTGAGGSFTIYYEKDGEMNAGDYRIFWSKSANGEYKEVKLDEVSGYYQIRNVQSDVYVKIYGRDGFPVSNEAIEATEARAYAQVNKIIVVTREPMDVQIVSMAGAVVGNAKVAGQQEFGNLAEGVYIVRLGETVVKLQVRN